MALQQRKAKKPLLGFCPIGKFVFSNEDAVKYKKLLQDKLKAWEVDFVDLEGVLSDGLVRDQSHVAAVVEHFRNSKIDCLFLPHCNFGTEGAVGMIAKKLNVPALLWGPRDEAPLPDGTRLRDSLCGLLASSKVLYKLNVPFTYIENCRVDEEVFKNEFDTFLRAVNIAKVLTGGFRIGHIGQRIDFFWSTIINENELLDKFHIEILPMDLFTFIEESKQRATKDSNLYKNEIKQIKKSHKLEGFESDQQLANILAVRDQMNFLVEQYDLDGLTIQPFMSIINAVKGYVSFSESCVSDKHPYASESDIHGVISTALAMRATFDSQPSFLTEFTVRHATNDNAVLLWHAGAPLNMCHPDERIRLGTHWILPSPLPGMTHFKLKDGPVTVARFDGERGDYCLAVGHGKTTDGPETLNNYQWMEVDNWPAWERKLIEGPFIHHVAMIYGNYSKAMMEACKYVPGLRPVPLNG